ncbi:MAG: alanine dehydrogenase [Flavobacteriales bacterium]|nr:alanine dehydrogenase [Flavobacteriales bacterium]
MLKIGIIKEGKNPPDERVPLAPIQCKKIMHLFPQIKIYVQESMVRRFKNEDYISEGIEVKTDLSDCDILLGVKEIPLEMLIENKTYFFFSHTIKKQPYNKKLLQAILKKNITLVDWETLKNKNGIRLIGFGFYAGIVGCYNAMYAWGMKHKTFTLKRAYLCNDRQELIKELSRITLPPIKIALTGSGRVAKGATEILDAMKIKKVSPSDFLTQTYSEPVFTQLDVKEYVKRSDETNWKETDFFKNPEGYESNFMPYAKVADLYLACHFWDNKAPVLFTKEDARSENFQIKVIADISCDVNGPIASTIRASTIQQPLYGYNPITEKEVNYDDSAAITVMAVDNLPCELPKDASYGFGEEIIQNVLPHLLNSDAEDIIKNATIAEKGLLTANFSYLSDYVSE